LEKSQSDLRTAFEVELQTALKQMKEKADEDAQKMLAVKLQQERAKLLQEFDEARKSRDEQVLRTKEILGILSKNS
jgi:uncharacterized protein YpiB (UPF0302 family)